MPKQPTPSVVEAIRQVVAGLADPANSYFVNGIYYEYEGEKRFTADIWLQADDVRNPVAAEEALEVHLSPTKPTWYPIRIPYAVIYRVQRARNGGMQFTGADPTLFYSQEAFEQLMPLWRAEVTKNQTLSNP